MYIPSDIVSGLDPLLFSVYFSTIVAPLISVSFCRLVLYSLQDLEHKRSPVVLQIMNKPPLDARG